MVSNVADPKVFEDKRVEVDFQNVFAQLAQMEWRNLIDPYRYAYIQGYEAGKARERERLGSPTTETVESPLSSSD
jgi:hypothetical protein